MSIKKNDHCEVKRESAVLLSCGDFVSAELSFDEENACEIRGQVSWYCLSVSRVR